MRSRISNRQLVCAVRKSFNRAASSSSAAPAVTSAAPNRTPLAKLLQEDEAKTLWGTTLEARFTSRSDMLQLYSRLGFDHLHPLRTSTLNPFESEEDYLGASLLATGDRLRSAHTVWARYFRNRYLSQLRNSRTTGANFVGTLRSATAEDECDQPSTPWAQDRYFVELAAFARSQMKCPAVTNMMQFDVAVRGCTSEAYAAFLELPQPAHQACAPLPPCAGYVYSGEERVAWCTRWKPLQIEADKFAEKLRAAAETKGWPTISAALAKAMEKVDEIRECRRERQEKEGKRQPWSRMSPQQKIALCSNELALSYKGYLKGVFDAEDGADVSEAWAAEHRSIESALIADIASCGFTAYDVWKHTDCVFAIEHQYLYTTPHLLELGARALQRAKDEFGTQRDLDAQLRESFEKSRLDTRNGRVIPHMNDAWVKTHWWVYGGSGIYQHTNAGTRHIAFHNASLEHARALATLFFKLLPLSSDVDYSTPYKYRRSIVAALTEYAIALTTSSERTTLSVIGALHQADALTREVVTATRRTLGESRRAQDEQVRLEQAKRLPPVNGVFIGLTPDCDSSLPETNWPMGARRYVRFLWASPHFSAPAQIISGAELSEQRERVGIEISLWQRIPAAADTPPTSQLDVLCRSAPELSNVRDEVIALSKRIGIVEGKPDSAIPTARPEWKYITMLADNAPADRTCSVAVVLPFFEDHQAASKECPKKRLSEGTYCIRVRAFDNVVNPQHDARFAVESYSPSFEVSNPLPDLLSSFFETSKEVPQTVPRDRFIALFQHLRSFGPIEAPLEMEFQAGQVLSGEGDPIIAHIISHVEKGTGLPSMVNEGLTQPQLEAEEKIRDCWEVRHPGTSDDEWAGVRRGVLNDAFSNDQEWWRDDSYLTADFSPSLAHATKRYQTDLMCCLTARGTSLPCQQQNVFRPVVTCRFCGDGTVPELHIDPNEVRDRKLGLASVLEHARAAINDANTTLNILAASKLRESEALAKLAVLGGKDFTEVGGKYARTYHYAYQKAVAELDAADTMNLERVHPADRFASQDNAELRRRWFTPAIGTNQENIDDTPLEHRSDWRPS